MKKTAAFFVCAILIFSLLSCGKQEIPETDLPQTTEGFPIESTNIGGETGTESTENPTVPVSQNASYQSMTTLTDTPTRLLYSMTGNLYYYNKLTESVHTFCFDPLCHHQSDCISAKFVMNGTNTSIRYCAVNNRFYAFRGDQFCSFSFDGSDLRIEYSFGENGDFADFGYAPHGTYELTVHGDRVYFLRLDNENGTRQLWYFDVHAGKMHNLMENSNRQMSAYLIENNTIYSELVGEEESGIYQSDMDFSHLEKLPSDLNSAFVYGGIFHNGEVYYMTAHAEKIEGKTHILSDEIVAFSPVTNEKRCVQTLKNTEMGELLAVTDDAVYYTCMEKRSIGFYENIYEKKEMYNSHSRIYKVQNGKVTKVFDDILCNVKEIYFLGDGKVFVLGEECFISDTNAHRTAATFLVNLDDMGNFVALRKVDVT